MYAIEINEVIHALAAFNGMLDLSQRICDIFVKRDVENNEDSPYASHTECKDVQQITESHGEDGLKDKREQATTCLKNNDLTNLNYTSSEERECLSSDIDKIPLCDDDIRYLHNNHNSWCEQNECTDDQKEKIVETASSERNEDKTDSHPFLPHHEGREDIEQDTEHFYSFVSNCTVEQIKNKSHSDSENAVNPDISENNKDAEIAKNSLVHDTSGFSNGNQTSCDNQSISDHVCNEHPEDNFEIDNGLCDRRVKFTTASCDLMYIVESLYSIKESPAFQVFPHPDEIFEEKLYILSDGAFQEHPEDYYLVRIEESVLDISKDSQILLSLNMKYGEVSIGMKNTLKVDNKMGRCIYIKCDFESMVNLKTEIELHCLKHWQTDCLHLVHYPLKHHQNTIIVDLGSTSTRAGILMDQPTLPSIFFPTICATNRKTGENIYGMEALHPEVRQHSIISFPCRPSMKITKHTIDIDQLEGLFKKIFRDLQVNPDEYTVLVCLPQNLSIPSQTALVNLLLEKIKVKSVSLANQALLTLYAHEVSTAVVINIGERTEILPVVDGFIVESGVTKLPLGGQSLIDHMKHGLAEKHVNLSSNIDSYVVQYIIEQVAYVANDYENEIRLSSQQPNLLKKTVTIQSATATNLGIKSITLDEARFKVCEGLFDPELWGIDSPGIHQLVNKAIQATGVDVRKKIAENIYVSGGMTMLPGFVERLNKEVSKISKAKIVPKVFASNYRYHCTYIGACKFAKMDVFPRVCISSDEFSRNGISTLKKCALYF